MAPKPKVKSNAVIAAAQARVAQMKALEEQRLAEEKIEREAEEKRLAEEAAIKKAADDAREAELKARENARAEAKKAGTYLSTAEKKRRKELEERKQRLLQAGFQVAAFQEDGAAPADAEKKTVKKHKKRLPKTIEEEIAEAAAKKAAEEERLRLEKLAETEDERATDDLDWEEQAAREERRAARAARKATEAAIPAPVAKAGASDSDEWPSDSEDEEDDEHDASPPASVPSAPAPKLKGADAARAALLAKKNAEPKPPKYVSPVCCIMGHVDTGKTKLLDKIRRTNVQEGEAGGITQQIGATFFPEAALLEQIKKVDKAYKLQVPGLLIIDTPGHEQFNNLRSRGSSLCNVAILVVDIMHGLEPQTIESLNMLVKKKVPFVIALNKIDRMYEWSSKEYRPTREALTANDSACKQEFEDRLGRIQLALAQQGLNTALYWQNDSHEDTVSIVPTSAITGEGIPDILHQLLEMTQGKLSDPKKLSFKSELKCTVLEVKNIEGLGTTVDVMLSQGTLREGDTIVVCGMSGPIVTQVRALLTPQPLREMRIKADYIHHKCIHAAMGIKISAPGLEEAVAGTNLFVVGPDDDVEELEDEVMQDMSDIFKSVDRSGVGVYVMASTLGSLEALLTFLKDEKVPVFDVALGTVNSKNVKKASIMREKGREDLSVILAFDVKIDPEAVKEAEHAGVTIFSAEIIYHLTQKFQKYLAEVEEQRKKDRNDKVVFPCVLKIMPQYIFNKRDPIVLGVLVEDGLLRVGTPICVPEKDNLNLGRVVSIEFNKKAVNEGKKGQEVCVKIAPPVSDVPAFGRHFDETHKLVSKMTRDGIDVLKDLYRDTLSKDDWKLVVKLKELFKI